MARVFTGSVPLAGGNRDDLVGRPREGMRAALEEAGLDAKAAKLRGKQIWPWIYHRGVTEFDAMTDIAKAMRPWLTVRLTVGGRTGAGARLSNDGTSDWLPAAADGRQYARSAERAVGQR